MKKHLILLIVIPMTAVLIVACKKSPIPIPVGMSATIHSFNGTWSNTDWLATTYYTFFDTSATGETGITIYGNDSTLITRPPPSNYFYLTFVYTKYKTGVYTLKYPTCAMSYGGIPFTAGTIAISRFSTTNIEGTFNCANGSDFTVTNGQFNIPIK